jgi:hypothetical protein
MNISPCFNPQYPQASGDFFTPGLIRQSAAAHCRHRYFVIQISLFVAAARHDEKPGRRVAAG